ncbi:hypothetical protein [Lysobacter gummosus]
MNTGRPGRSRNPRCPTARRSPMPTMRPSAWPMSRTTPATASTTRSTMKAIGSRRTPGPPPVL